ncbi:sugar ABC transporter substrate-binding protein [Modestobacter altitudinis]|uniref:sugar ABC transporter substrate-binding protein n=1 Tax=Modestobacter altitudinis TaxID=2213158 RepID=UPI00110CD6AC|nr:substrate-binding domain-containing protein [Modestobacter altitudinis]
MSKSPRRYGIGAVLALVFAILLSACSSPSEVASGSGSSSAASSASGAPASGASQQALDTAYEGEIGTPPSTPTTPPAGVDLWVVSCGEQVPGCAVPTAAAREAGETVGWTVNVCDGQLNPNGWGTCVRQAISAGAKVIIPIGIDCPSVQQPFQEAKDAGITVVGGGGVDCDAAGGQALWASNRIELDGVAPQDYYELMGQLAADWLIGKTDGTAQVVQLNFTDAVWGKWMATGFSDEIATCDGCAIAATLDYSNQDVGSGTLPQKFSTALLQAPDANAVFFPVGGIVNVGLAQAVVASGRSADLQVVSGLGGGPNLDLIRNDGGLDATVAIPAEWGAWGSVDTAIRALNGEEPQPQGSGVQVVDADHNMPETGQPFTGEVDYQAAYEKAWGV